MSYIRKRSFIVIRRLLAVSMLLTLVWSFAVVSVSAATTGNRSWLRIMHASPDTSPVDVFVDGQVVLSNVGFKTVSDYLNVPAGSPTIAMAPTGQGVKEAVLTTTPTLVPDKAYTLVVTGLANVGASIYEDNLAPPSSGQARIRVIHASPDATGADVEVIGGPTLFQNVEYAKASPYIEIAAKPYNLRVVANGTNNAFVWVPTMQFAAGTVYDLVVLDRIANVMVKVAAYTPSASGSGGTSTSAVLGAPSTMPPTGASSSSTLSLLGLGCIMVVAGFIMRRRWYTRLASSPTQTQY